MPASIGFYGAAETVTGSKFVLTTEGKEILVDCGMFQGPRALRERNWEPFLFDPTRLDAAVLTHAHADHIGMVPLLVKEGYPGKIMATHGTVGISKISLPDSGRLMEEEARYLGKHRLSRHDPVLPLYTERDAYTAIRRLHAVNYHKPMQMPGGCTMTFIPAGHILGSAMVQTELKDGTKVLFGGDLGRFGTPIIIDPEWVDETDYLILESTYGDRLHGDENSEQVIEEVIKEAVRDSLCVLVPSFAIGRTQELLYTIAKLQRENKIPRIPIFVDSPMAVSATALYDRTREDHDVDFLAESAEGSDPLSPDLLQMVRDRNQSKALNSRTGPMMIIAGSGMATGGRIVHHLKHRLSREDTYVLFTGYQGEGTMGREMIEGAKSVEIHGSEIPVQARVRQMTSLSAHADYEEILQWLGGFKRAPKRVFLVHGEPGPQASLREKIVQQYGWNVTIPKHGAVIELE